MTKIFKTPFGALGDKQEVPVSTQTDGSVSYEQGFGVDYQRDYEDPQAKDIPREKLNQLFYDMTKALGELQKFGYMQWQAGEYQAGDRVAEGGVAYKAVRATSNKPPHNDWAAITEGGPFVTESGDQTVSGTKKFTSFPVTPSAAPTANYHAANKKYVDDSVAVPVDQIFTFESALPPDGYIARNGQAIDSARMPKLYARYGANMPDDRNRVYRMQGDLTGAVGSSQEDAGQAISGIINDALFAGFGGASGVMQYRPRGSIQVINEGAWSTANISFDSSLVSRTANETRVKSRIVIFCNKIQ